MSLSKVSLIQILKIEKPFLEKNFGVCSLALFGAYARDEQSESSDVDILVELERPSFDWLIGLQFHLENKLQKKVDIVRNSGHLKKDFVNVIQHDLIYV